MDKQSIIDALVRLNANKPWDCDGDILQLLECNVADTISKYNIDLSTLSNYNPQITRLNVNNCDTTIVWTYLELNFYLLLQLKDMYEKSNDEDFLSLQDTSNLRTAINAVVTVGIRFNLLPDMHYHVKCKSPALPSEDHLRQFSRLSATSYGLYMFAKNPKLCSQVIVPLFEPVLNGLYQIVYCPLKKPTAKNDGDFVMSQEMYELLLREKKMFRTCLEHYAESMDKFAYLKATIMMMKCGKWFLKAASLNLTKVLRSEKGLETVISTLLETSSANSDDAGQVCKAEELTVSLVMSLRNSQDFKSNVCVQIGGLLGVTPEKPEHIRSYQNIYVTCLKTLYKDDKEFCQDYFVKQLLGPLRDLTNIGRKFGCEENVTDVIVRTIKVLYNTFIVGSFAMPTLPMEVLTPVANVLFRLHCVSKNLRDLNEQVQELLLGYIKAHRGNIYEAFLFNTSTHQILGFRTDVELQCKDRCIVVVPLSHNARQDYRKNGDFIIKLLSKHDNLLVEFFAFLLKCLCDKPESLEHVERQLVIYSLLANLAENKTIYTHLNEDPECIVEYIAAVLVNTIESNVHTAKNVETTDFQSVFVTLMVLQTIAANCAEKKERFQKLIEPLRTIQCQCANDELREMVRDILGKLLDDRVPSAGKRETTAVDRAIEDVCDPLLPVRGHGLMELAKLVEQKDEHAMERKMFILNIFQQNLKNDDSYIYLSSINGLVAIADVFPEMVLSTLVDEYSDFNKKDAENNNELRMKVGEVLVRVVKKLGDTAAKHKSLLLNCFLEGTKDDDHLVRASALSNLGETCRVLGYKLGSIVVEVLECVHAVITTDKAVEARRAAVTVIRQLFVGLESETIDFLKDDILDIYRTLKKIYANDKDEVMRLQAQLALEELNENVIKYLRTLTVPR